MKLFGIVYGPHTTEFIPYQNNYPEKAWRWEYGPMINIMDYVEPNDEPVGIFSYKFPQKTGFTRAQVMDAITRHDSDVWNFSRPIPSVHFMDWSDKGHVGIKSFVQRCCKHVGLEYTNDPQNIIYSNQFVAKAWIYKDYIETVIKPCLNLLEGLMWTEVNKDAGYTRAIQQPRLRQLTGLEFYNYITFILERMMMQYVHNKGYKCLNLGR